MTLQVTCLQRSHENLVLILISLKPCLHVFRHAMWDSNVVSPPLHSLGKAAQSIPLHPQPALHRNQQHCSFSAHRPPESLWAQRNSLLWCKSGLKRPSALPYTPKDAHLFSWGSVHHHWNDSEASWLTCWERGAGGCNLEKGAASQFISGLIQQGKLRIGLTSVYEPKCQRADDTYCKCQSQGIFIFPLQEHQQRFSDYWCCYSHRLSMNGAVHIHKHTGEILKGLA